MSTQRYSVTPHPVETLLTWVKSGEIAIPEIQRPFVWEATKVRNLLDEAVAYPAYFAGYYCVTAKMEARFKKSAAPGQRLLITSRISTMRDKVLEADAEVRDKW